MTEGQDAVAASHRAKHWSKPGWLDFIPASDWLRITSRRGKVIHGKLVAGSTVSWSRPRRETAVLTTVSWSHKPIYNTYIFLPVVTGVISEDNSCRAQGEITKKVAFRRNEPRQPTHTCGNSRTFPT